VRAGVRGVATDGRRVNRICVLSGKRGGYGAYVPLMRLIDADPELELVILLADMHGSREFGNTIDEVRADFPDTALELIEMGTGRGDSPLVRAENLGLCLANAARILERVRPDVVLVHGDRGEHLIVAFAALNLGLAVAHTQGGDRSGNIDELQRHAITKLVHVHFPETETAAERIRRLGEDAWRVHLVGSTYVDRIVKQLYVPPQEARRLLGLDPSEPFLLAVVHPETYLDREANRRQAEAVLKAVEATGLRTVVTYPCSDPGYEGVLEALRAREGNPAFVIRRNVENDVYLGLMASAEALVGNSSAALVEAPYFHLPAVNVGRRQDGRERDANVADAPPDPAAVAAVVSRLRQPEFRAALNGGGRLGDGRASERIVDVLRALRLDDRLLRKQIAY
jgi:GDP/UDP-N,N'-diacetylbacillosamine 2-epimerase (hydrolysing)